jgi:hypothetical protein
MASTKKISFYQFSAAVAFIWFGMVCAISFLEAWLKFEAPGVTLPIGLGIGRLVFAALNKMELIFALVLLLIFLRNREFTIWKSIWFYTIVVVLLAQTFYLLPTLDARALKVIAGESVPSSYLHLTYILLEFCKAFSLLVFGVKNLNQHSDERNT